MFRALSFHFLVTIGELNHSRSGSFVVRRALQEARRRPRAAGHAASFGAELRMGEIDMTKELQARQTSTQHLQSNYERICVLSPAASWSASCTDAHSTVKPVICKRRF